MLDDEKKATVFSWSLVLSTKAPKVGWIVSSLEATCEINATNHDHLIDFSNNTIVTPFNDYEQWENAGVVYWAYAPEDLIGEKFSDWAYHDIIYNLKIEDFHTYFVGELGVWMHQ